jgi:hypothetical protein
MTTFNLPRLVNSLTVSLAFVAALPGVASAAPGVGALVREAVEMAFKTSGREVVERVSREAAEEAVEKGVAKYGPRAAQAVADGGMELVEASARYGDDVMRVAVEASPAARRALALQPGQMLPLVREFGGEAIELEAKSPGLARRMFTSFGDDGARQIARQVPAEDMPRLLTYAEKADSPETRRLLLEAYKKEGPSIFERIPPKLVLATGLTGAILYGAHRTTAPLDAIGDAIRNDPALARDVSNGFLWIYGTVAILATVFILASFRLTPWHAVKPRADRGQPVDGGRHFSPEIGSAESRTADALRG